MNKIYLINNKLSFTSIICNFTVRAHKYNQAFAYSLILSHLTFIPYAHAGPTGGNTLNLNNQSTFKCDSYHPNANPSHG